MRQQSIGDELPPEHSSRYAHLKCLALDTVWMVDENIWSTTHNNFSRLFVKGDRVQRIGIIDVYRLEKRLRAAEDDQRVAGNIRLKSTPVGSD